MALTSGKRPRALLHTVFQVGEQLAHDLNTVIKLARVLVDTHLEVFFNSQTREDVIGLGHHADTACDQLVGFQPGDVFSQQRNRATTDIHLAEDCFEKRRLPGPVWSDDANQFTVVRGEIAVFKNVDTGQVASGQVGDIDNVGLRGHCFPSGIRPVTTPRSVS